MIKLGDFLFTIHISSIKKSIKSVEKYYINIYNKKSKFTEERKVKMEELDLKELFSMFWNMKVEIVLITLLAMIAGVIYSYFFITPKYTAKTSLILVQSSDTVSKDGSSGITSTDLTINSKLVSTYVVLDKVASNLGIDKAEVQKIKNRINVSMAKDTEIIDIKVTDEDPNYATKIANEVATVFSEQIAEIYNMSNIYLLERAEVPTVPSNINHVRDIVIFAFLGIVISVAYVLIVNLLDHTIKTEEDIEKATGLLTLATIPDYEAEFKTAKGGKR